MQADTDYLQCSWQSYSFIPDSPFQEVELYLQDVDAEMSPLDFPSPSISMVESSDTSFSALFSSRAGEALALPIQGEDFPLMVPVEQYSPGWQASDQDILPDQFLVLDQEHEQVGSVSNLPSQISDQDDSWTLDVAPMLQPSEAYMSTLSAKKSLVLPSKDIEVDDELAIFHLLKAYAEARESKQGVLAEEISRRLREKCSPTSTTLERVAYYLTQASDKQGDHLRQESTKNLQAALFAFYQIFPFGRFAHFTSNSMILDQMPEDVDGLHIIDFDIGEGVQWPPLIEELARQGEKRACVTSLRWGEEDCGSSLAFERFEETKIRLTQHSHSVGLELEMEEVDLEGLVAKLNKRRGRREWLAFNCMVGLPHMTNRRRRIEDAMQFLEIAKDFLSYRCQINCASWKDKGIITFGDGIGLLDAVREWAGNWHFLEGKLVQLQALFELIEHRLPGNHLAGARVAMECLFLGPYVSLLSNVDEWQDTCKATSKMLSEMEMEAKSLSQKEQLVEEAKELVREGDDASYWVRVEGEKQHRVALGYKGTTVVGVCSWIQQSQCK